MKFSAIVLFCVACVLSISIAFVRADATTAPTARHVPTAADAITPVPRNGKWMARHLALVEMVKKHPDSQLIFVGDSITDFWQKQPSFKANYGLYDALDLGISGDRTQHVLYRIDNGEIDGLHPKVAVLMIGTNNASAGDKPEWIAAGVTKIVQELHEKLPTTKVLLLAIFPRGKKEDNRRLVNEQTNEIIAKLDGPDTKYLDIGAAFLDENGEIPLDVMKDLLHPTAKGYDLWAKAMAPTLDEMMK